MQVKRVLLAILLLFALFALLGCNYTLEAPNTGLVVEHYVNAKMFSDYNSLSFDENIIEDDIVAGNPYLVLQVKNNTSWTIDVRLKGSETSKNANWLASGESVTVKMVPGESLELYDGGDTFVANYTVTTGHYVPPANRLDVDRQETSATAK